MIINAAALARLYTSMTAVFNAAFQGADPFYPKVAMTVPSNTRIMDYKFLLDFPQMREWVGDRVIRDVKAEAFLVENKNYEATIEVRRDDIEDDQLGLYNPIVAALGEEARKHPDKLIGELLVGAWAATGYDGVPLISANHPVGDGVADNNGGGAGKPWFLIDNSRAIKPFIFQVRRAVQLTRMDTPQDENVFMRASYRYGVDGRWAVAPGLWQLVHGSKATLDAPAYDAARTAMLTLTNSEGRILGIRPTLLVVPPSLEGAARRILNAQFVIGDAVAGGAQTNIWQGTATILVVPELDLA